ncbi:LysR family transcriptional regulator [Saccharothrix coeruleofusca]|uniref:LysR family transcriptional regulator n=1 Tax=Saccharothrix coeruleofusca TaxID=33919 RepID=A0A918ALA7_9PSEU|nr:LysR family transcriptional regulator [Saccharothrix coeruleofusca]GGP55912.1 LysR family transcriptional regulator [Saccharothrix coeruleofusca]
MHKIDLNLLVPLQALLVEVNVTRAAERTNVGQPAMSASLAKLRRHFNDPLLVRDGRNMRLTRFAESLLEPVSRALGSMYDVMDQHVTFDPSRLRRRFTIVTSDYVTIVLIKPFLQSVLRMRPHVAVRIVNASDRITTLARRAEFDLLIAPSHLMPPGILGYQSRDLFADRLVAVADKNNIALGDRVSIDELVRLPFVDSMAGVKLLDGQSPAVAAIATVNFSAALNLIMGTPMVTLIQSRLYELIGPQCGLRAVPLQGGWQFAETMYWHPKFTADPAHTWLREELGDAAAALG